MASNQQQPLTYERLDDLTAAIRKRRISPKAAASLFAAQEIGPYLALEYATAEEPVGDLGRCRWTAAGALSRFQQALIRGETCWVSGDGGAVGFYRTTDPREQRDEDVRVHFSLRAQQAATSAGFDKRTAKRLAGAMGEIEENIHDHSRYRESGIVAFQALDGAFGIVVADAGAGVLATLREAPGFEDLADEGRAVELALRDGVSRLRAEDPDRGWGFHSLFVGLANLRGALRFASGDHALLIEGRGLSLIGAKLVQKARAPGFFVSVVCRP